MFFACNTFNGDAVTIQSFRLPLQAVGIRFSIADALFQFDFLMLQSEALNDAATAKEQVPRKRRGNGKDQQKAFVPKKAP
jgi:hypothetical protein